MTERRNRQKTGVRWCVGMPCGPRLMKKMLTRNFSYTSTLNPGYKGGTASSIIYWLENLVSIKLGLWSTNVWFTSGPPNFVFPVVKGFIGRKGFEEAGVGPSHDASLWDKNHFMLIMVRTRPGGVQVMPTHLEWYCFHLNSFFWSELTYTS